MNKPIAPCTQNCAERNANCHNASCPHGYGEYLEAQKKYYAEREKNGIFGPNMVEVSRGVTFSRKARDRRREKTLKTEYWK